MRPSRGGLQGGDRFLFFGSTTEIPVSGHKQWASPKPAICSPMDLTAHERDILHIPDLLGSEGEQNPKTHDLIFGHSTPADRNKTVALDLNTKNSDMLIG